ncbi:carboxyl transferase domain-containing protein [Actinomyces faecalis]|uniref:carboxyl transferase domain-containing protein n=1 Tax=Actinomyces faecalis TaxID=2722820 RepID=UPI0015569265|nr:carboxyl transferase domain-containing protein [Actinomyces faecalis]
MTRLLVAARASTAARVARSARRHGLSPVGVFTQADRDARWLDLLDDAVEVSTYDAVPALVAAARETGAHLLHPGVGFAAESASLARACLEAGLTWVGPSPETLDLVTDKAALARTAAGLGVPVPRTVGPVSTLDGLARACHEVAGPAVVKTVHGGGGRGVLPLPTTGPEEVEHAWRTLAGMGPLLVQADVPVARHVEVQALADGHGGILTLGTRECSVQRRAQKLIEEAPAPFLPGQLTDQLESWTRLVLRSVSLQGLATCEFLLPRGGTPVLLEVNARLQLEHAVTEEVCGTDLVRAQLVVAEGGGLTQVLATCGGHAEHRDGSRPAPTGSTAQSAQALEQHEPDLRVRTEGHAVEARLYAEDPQTLLPSQTPLRSLSVPLSTPQERAQVAAGQVPRPPRLRVERAVFAGDALQPGFSEPLALITASASSRQEALGVLEQTLAAVEVQGPPTLVPLLRQALCAPEMAGAGSAYEVTTRWVEERLRPQAPGAGLSGLSYPGPSLSVAPAAPTAPPGGAEGFHRGTPGTPGTSGTPGAPGSPALLSDVVELRAPMAGALVAPARPGPARAGQAVAVIEAMKMRLPLPAPADGVVDADGPVLEAGTPVAAGQVLARLLPEAPSALGDGSGSPAASTPTVPQPPTRRRRRPRAVERVRDLVDEGSLRDVVDEDAVLTAWAQVAGREVAVWAQDPSVMGGTIGLAGARRVAGLIDRAASQAVPVISLLDGGGARVQEGVNALAGVGLILAAQTRAHGRTLQLGLVLGPAAGGAAYAPALTDLLVMVEGEGEVFLTGPAILASSTGERTSPEKLGGAEVHARHAGTAHLTVPDEAAAWRAARALVGLARVPTSQGLALPLRTGGAGLEVAVGDRLTAQAVPADPSEPYDVRGLLRRLTDRGDLIELRPQWAPNVVTALARVEGVPLGVVANQPAVLAGALDPLSSQKVAEHVGLCARLGLPVLTVVDTPGFLPGTQAERAGTVRLGARMVAAYAGYEAGGGLLLTLITRRAFGGAYVALGSRALAGGRTAAWPGSQVGVMDAASAVDLVSRRQLRQAGQDGEDVEALREELIERERAAQAGEQAVDQGWVEELVAPESTRSWLARVLTCPAPPAEGTPAPRLTHVGGVHHPGDGWVECSCGSRHWGLRGAAGVLAWRLAAPSRDEVPPGGHSDETRSHDEAGLEVLLQLRAGWTHRGGTWGLPGGAVAEGESPAEAALRELEEETGLPARTLRLGLSHVQDHGPWSYSTFTAQAAADPAWDRLVAADGESTRLEWVRLVPEDGSWQHPGGGTLPLLPALEAVWDELAGLLPAPGSQLLVRVG